MSRATRWMCAAHLAGDALLLWLGYYWLGLGDASAGALVWSALVAGIAVCAALWLQAAAFALWRAPAGKAVSPVDPFRTALARVLPFLVAGAALCAVYLLLARWGAYSSTPASELASWLTLKLRVPVKPSAVFGVFNAVLWIVRWVVLPVLALPAFAGIAARGWRGFAEAGSRRDWKYWIITPALLVGAFWLPFKLIGWVPNLKPFWLQVVSFGLRFAAAYLLFVGCWLLVVFLTSSGKPERSQPKTAVSP